MERGEKLQFYMEQKGYNRSTLAKASGVPYTTIDSMIKNDMKNSSVDNVIKICRVLGIRVEDLIEEKQLAVAEEEPRYATDLSQKYFYFPIGVSAGLPINVEPIETAETITIPDELLGKWAGNKDIYFMRVNGESMNKIIPHDSLIAVKQIERHELKNGDIVVYSDGHDYAVKRYYDLGEKLAFKPESTDPTFTDYIVDKASEDLCIHGKVVTYVVNVN